MFNETTCKSCTRCHLSQTRKNVVYSRGPSDAQIMLIGEAPGETEDLEGLPFVGRAGKLLDQVLQQVGLFDRVYITNMIKCRPPNNRAPLVTELELCAGFLDYQISVVKPKILVLLGATALKWVDVFIFDRITQVRGQLRVVNKPPYLVLPTFHPSYVLRNPSQETFLRQDLAAVQKLIDNPDFDNVYCEVQAIMK